MRAYWCKSDNFGDALTPYLIEKISGQKAEYAEPSESEVTYMVTGSILNWNISHSIVWGCGIAFKNDEIKKPYEIRAVRGPISAQRVVDCGWSRPPVIGDPALVLPRIVSPVRSARYRLGIIPHVEDFRYIEPLCASKHDICCINLDKPVEEVLSQVCSCQTTISSSLHGLIVSAAYGLPTAWVQFSTRILGDGTKFYDFFDSIGMARYEAVNMMELDALPPDIYRLPILHAVNLDVEALWNACPFRPAAT